MTRLWIEFFFIFYTNSHNKSWKWTQKTEVSSRVPSLLLPPSVSSAAQFSFDLKLCLDHVWMGKRWKSISQMCTRTHIKANPISGFLTVCTFCAACFFCLALRVWPQSHVPFERKSISARDERPANATCWILNKLVSQVWREKNQACRLRHLQI